MRPSDPNMTKILAEAHVETLRGGRPRPAVRKLARRN
jgi:hypothetical protein